MEEQLSSTIKTNDQDCTINVEFELITDKSLTYNHVSDEAIDDEFMTPLAKYGDFSTRHVNCMSLSNPFGDLMIGDMTVYGSTNIISGINLAGDNCNVSSTNMEINNSSVHVLNTSIKIESSIVNLSSLNVEGLSIFNDATINGNLIVNGFVNGLNKPSTQIQNNTFLLFGDENCDGSWRMGIVGGNMCIQKMQSGVWVNKSTIQ
jgi:hypothetical protein